MRVLVTGANGFLGDALVAELSLQSNEVAVAVRSPHSNVRANKSAFVVGDISANTDWRQAVASVDAIVHLAARVHVMRETADDPMAEFRRVNTDGTLNLARQAAAAGVRRFVFVSSVGVNGKATESGTAFTEADVPSPYDAYTLSKYEAEVGLRALAQTTRMEMVIVRPTLVYGRGAPGNFRRLTRLVAKDRLLPLASITNRRSLLGIDNFVNFIWICIKHSAAANETFLVSDGEDLSTPDLIRRLSIAMNRKERLVGVPVPLLWAAAAMLGKRDEAQRICGSLQVDISKARTLLRWHPPVSVDEGLRRSIANGHAETLR
jgi:nucleoside-diphosphate-sugar epimerase